MEKAQNKERAGSWKVSVLVYKHFALIYLGTCVYIFRGLLGLRMMSEMWDSRSESSSPPLIETILRKHRKATDNRCVAKKRRYIRSLSSRLGTSMDGCSRYSELFVLMKLSRAIEMTGVVKK